MGRENAIGECVIQDPGDTWRMEDLVHQVVPKPVHVLLEEVRYGRIWRHIKVVNNFSLKEGKDMLLHRCHIQGHVEEAMNLSLDGLVWMHFRINRTGSFDMLFVAPFVHPDL